MTRRPVPAWPLAVIGAAVLVGCAGPRGGGSPDDEPTIASLAGRRVAVDRDAPAATDTARARAAWQAVLQPTGRPLPAAQHAEALRRLGDLELEQAESDATAAVDTRAAIARYRERLAAHPRAAGNDRVLYQLARAEELGGDGAAALATLTRLVGEHPASPHAAEAHFRRGELLFVAGRYPAAEAAYAAVVDPSAGGAETALHDRAGYMLGWSRYKQGRLAEALHAFFDVLDRRLVAAPTGAAAASAASAAPAAGGEGAEADLRRDDDAADARLARGDRELLQDTLRVTALALAGLDGAASIPAYVDRPARRDYAPRIHRELAGLYLGQQRIQDAADTYAAFARREPGHPQAPLMQARVVDLYADAGFDGRARQARRDYVTTWGPDSPHRRTHPQAWQRAEPRVRAWVDELARHHHGASQRARAAGDAAAATREAGEAIRWYGTAAEAWPTDAGTAQRRFLMAEVLTEERRSAEAAAAYEAAAYAHTRHDRSAEAGYSAVLARRALADAPAGGTPDAGAPARATESALRFARTFADDPRATAVLGDAAERLLLQGDANAAARVAREVLARDGRPAGAGTPPAAATAAQRRAAWRIVGQVALDRRAFADAESAFAEALAAGGDTPSDAATTTARRDLADRLAVAIYRQAEAARTRGDTAAAIGHFERVGARAPGTAAAASAQFDAAVARIALRDWDGAARALEAFRVQQPDSALQAEVSARLAAVHLERHDPAAAALEFERVALAPPPSAGAEGAELARAAGLQAADLHERAGARDRAARAWTAYLRRHPSPADDAAHARFRLLQILALDPAPVLAAWSAPAAATVAAAGAPAAAAPGRGRSVARAGTAGPSPTAATLAETLWRGIAEADAQATGEPRSARLQVLGGLARLALTEPQARAYREVALVEPLQRQLALKKQRLQALLARHEQIAAGAGVEVTAAVTARTAALYEDFGRALLQSQRPRGLARAAVEQYQVMLEEQAFPFEEKAIELHTANARRTAQGLYDASVRASLQALARLQPVRWGKAERGDGAAAPALDAERLERFEQARRAADARPDDATAALRLALAARAAGRFPDARAAYERTLALSPDEPAALLNLAILHDLYLGEPARAIPLYERYARRVPGEAATVQRWLADLRRRPAEAMAAAATAPPSTPSTTPSAAAANPGPATAR